MIKMQADIKLTGRLIVHLYPTPFPHPTSRLHPTSPPPRLHDTQHAEAPQTTQATRHLPHPRPPPCPHLRCPHPPHPPPAHPHPHPHFLLPHHHLPHNPLRSHRHPLGSHPAHTPPPPLAANPSRPVRPPPFTRRAPRRHHCARRKPARRGPVRGGELPRGAGRGPKVTARACRAGV
ncbi:hypothetical protein BZA05DRAFT_412429 [Tricharina praecox]|uniref:uncharacterized protein n=1 Tax=Tricharina praecox TaxID=43433 RepID=UPI002220F88F|nr:uncharacterized protein BZA05DRAFT_412429 [Tricharina praecox]KAI5842241.1 hypothetical protein BZA05DRAFT_412429 [Tricharina praecox]